MKLKDIDIAAISLVDKGANRKRFYIIKRSESMDDFIKLIKDWLGEEELNDEQIAKINDLSEDKVRELTKAVEEFEEYKQYMSEDFEKAASLLLKNAIYDYPTKESEVEFDIDKVGASLSKITRVQLEKIKSIVDDLLKKKEDKRKADGTDKLSPEMLAKLEQAEEIIKAQEKKEKEAKEKEIDDLKKDVADLKKQLKEKGVKKSIDSDDDGNNKKDKDDDDEDKWPSVPMIVKARSQ